MRDHATYPSTFFDISVLRDSVELDPCLVGVVLVGVAYLGALVTASLNCVAGLTAKVLVEHVPGWNEIL